MKVEEVLKNILNIREKAIMKEDKETTEQLENILVYLVDKNFDEQMMLKESKEFELVNNKLEDVRKEVFNLKSITNISIF